MALGDPYATIQELKTRYAIADSNDDVLLTRALKVASEHIEDNVCKRQFNDAGTVSARKYDPIGYHVAYTHDFHTTTGLIVKADDNDDGTAETTWTEGTDFEVRRSQDDDGRPYIKLAAVGSKTFPNTRRKSLEVTARWGWATVPWEVREATLILAEELWKLKDAPFGIAGMGDFGAVRVRENPKVSALLKEFKRRGALIR